MARRVFFSFHYDRDIFRVSQVRNSGVVTSKYQGTGFIDHASWESLKKQGDDAIKRWINAQLDGASVTVVLIGAETYGREWVGYEIQRSVEQNKGLLGVYIHQLIDPRTKLPDVRGRNPFDFFHFTTSNPVVYLSQVYPTYDWVNDDGYNNFSKWVESAAVRVRR